MKKFLVLYKVSADAGKQTAAMTPEQQAAGMNAWMTWAQQCGEKLVDLGQPLANAVSVTPEGTETADTPIAGFSILQAATREEALQLLQGHPHLGWNATCTIELHEAQPLPGM